MPATIYTIRTALQIYGAMNRFEYDTADALRAANEGLLRSHRGVSAVQATIGLAAPLVLARSAREREKSSLGKSREAPRWTVRNALRVLGDRYREAVGIARRAVEKVGERASDRNRQALRRALRFYGDLWRMENPALSLA